MMKKFNMFAIIALSLAVAGGVNAAGGTAFGTVPNSSQIVNQRGTLAAAALSSRPTALNIQSQAINAGTPAAALSVGASAAIDNMTKGKVNSLFDAAAFGSGAQVTNSARSAVAGGTNQIGEVLGTDARILSDGLTGGNLKTALTGMPSSTAAKSAISSIASGVSNKVSNKFINSTAAKAGEASSGNANGVAGLAGILATGTQPAGVFGNVTSSSDASTVGSNAVIGRTTGGLADVRLYGNGGPNS